MSDPKEWKWPRLRAPRLQPQPRQADHRDEEPVRDFVRPSMGPRRSDQDRKPNKVPRAGGVDVETR